MKSGDIKDNFVQLKKLLVKHAKGLEIRTVWGDSKAKVKKPGYHLYGTKEAYVFRKLQKMYVSGIIQQKNFVGFYSMPIYSHPKQFPKIGPKTRKLLKGKSCFHITHLDKNIINDLDYIITQGKKIYKKEGWI